MIKFKKNYSPLGKKQKKIDIYYYTMTKLIILLLEVLSFVFKKSTKKRRYEENFIMLLFLQFDILYFVIFVVVYKEVTLW